MIIDSHAHACGNFLKGENIISALDQNQITKVVLVPGELNSDRDYYIPNFAKSFPNKDIVRFTNITTKIIIKLTRKIKDIEQGNEYLYSLVHKYPERLIQFYWCVLNSPEAIDKLEINFKRWKFKGLKIHQCWESFTYKSGIFKDVSKFAEENNLPIFIHAYSKKDIHDLIKFSNENPKTIIIIGHLFGLEQFINSDCQFANIFFEISTPQLVSETRLLSAINHFGADKILFGSDIPYGKNNQKLNIDRIKNLNIKQIDREKILGKNIKAILNL